MIFMWIWIVSVLYPLKISGYEMFSSTNCSNGVGVSQCSGFIICTEDRDRNLYPGKIKSLNHDIYFPNGTSMNTSASFSSEKGSVIIRHAHVPYNDASILMSVPKFHTEIMGKATKYACLPTKAEYIIGSAICDGSRVADDVHSVNPCTYCLVTLTVEYLLADLHGVFDNSERNVTLILSALNALTEVTTTFVLKPTLNTTDNSKLSIEDPSMMEIPTNHGGKLKLQAVFPNPLSAYKVNFTVFEPQLRFGGMIATSVGKHFDGIEFGCKIPKEWKCLSPKTITVDFGYLPNIGAYDYDSPSTANTIDFDVYLTMRGDGTVGKIYRLDIDLEVDSRIVENMTKLIIATDEIAINTNIVISQSSTSLPKNGGGSVTLEWNVPPYLTGIYEIKVSSKRYAGPGGDGLLVAGIKVSKHEYNVQCIFGVDVVKFDDFVRIKAINVPLSAHPENGLGLKVFVTAQSNTVEVHSTHELTVTFHYPGEGSPQIFQLYFNITDTEIFTEPGGLPMSMSEICKSITPTTNVILTLHTDFTTQYGDLLLELPVPSNFTGQIFVLRDFLNRNGFNVFGNFSTTTTKREDGLTEKLLLKIFSFSNIQLRLGESADDHASLAMNVTFIDATPRLNSTTMPFTARLISNNKVIWTENLPITTPSIEYHPDFIVTTAIEKSTDGNLTKLLYHFSRNGTYYSQEEITWESGSKVYLFDLPLVISHFYFTASTAICHVNTVSLPFKNYVKIEKDDNNVMLRTLPYTLDQDLDTCMDLPVPVDSPSMLWLRFIRLGLFGVTSKKFAVHLTGEGIECTHDGQKSLRVGTSGPATDGDCSIKSDIVFCKLLSKNSISGLTRCDLQCECDTLQKCSDVHIVMQSPTHDVWRLCEITMNNVV